MRERRPGRTDDLQERRKSELRTRGSPYSTPDELYFLLSLSSWQQVSFPGGGLRYLCLSHPSPTSASDASTESVTSGRLQLPTLQARSRLWALALAFISLGNSFTLSSSQSRKRFSLLSPTWAPHAESVWAEDPVMLWNDEHLLPPVAIRCVSCEEHFISLCLLRSRSSRSLD